MSLRLSATGGGIMERFFFDLIGHSGERQYDHRGVELPDIVAAEIEARDMLKRSAGAMSNWQSIAISSATESKAVVKLADVGSANSNSR